VTTVIKSCETPQQLEGATRMVNQFKSIYKAVGYQRILHYSLDRLIEKQNKWIQ
tara:strand:- start:429 stop:590 length:162 start_codon:yes stop_codon:yes gene_type:complete